MQPKITVHAPLTRRGKGPGIVVVLSGDYVATDSSDPKKPLDPEPAHKWAEEGFAVAEFTVRPPDSLNEGLRECLERLRALPQCDTDDKFGVVVYNLHLQGDSIQSKQLWEYLRDDESIAAIVDFSDQPGRLPSTKSTPRMVHATLRSPTEEFTESETVHVYPESVSSTDFILPSHQDYAPNLSNVAHTRSLGFLRKHLNGPHFDLEAIWDEHTFFEFVERDVEKTMATMVEEPYVNHVPTMTGGVGREALTSFYRDHFIFNNPADTNLELVSRTVGVDRVIDEFIFCFTHDKIIDWLVPGIPPTGKAVRIPFTSVVNIRGDRLYHEHIAWDQASLLRQLELLPDFLPFPYPLPDGRMPSKGKRFEYRVPTSGSETARKMIDERSVESNTMLNFEIREVDDV